MKFWSALSLQLSITSPAPIKVLILALQKPSPASKQEPQDLHDVEMWSKNTTVKEAHNTCIHQLQELLHSTKRRPPSLAFHWISGLLWQGLS